MSAAQGADLLGLAPGMVVEEVGWDDDVDAALRDDIMDIIDADMVEEALEGVDAVPVAIDSFVDVRQAEERLDQLPLLTSPPRGSRRSRRTRRCCRAWTSGAAARWSPRC